MRIRIVLPIIAALVVASITGTRVEAQPTTLGSAQGGLAAPSLFKPAEGKDPYKQLFRTPSVRVAQERVQPPRTRAAEDESAPLTKPTVVCGTLLIPADGSVDPRMRLSPETNDTTKHTIRAVKPPMCHPE